MLKHLKFPPASGKTEGAVILLHGLSGDGAMWLDIVRRWQNVLPDTEFICPYAPFPCEVQTYGLEWFRWLSLTAPSADFIVADMQPAFRMLAEFIDIIMATRQLPADKVALVGYSQGASMSLYAAPRLSQQLAGVLCFAGQIFGGETLPTEKKSSPPFLIVHGAKDAVIPLSWTETAAAFLKAAAIPALPVIHPDLDHHMGDFFVEFGAEFLKKILYKESA